jgi:hypothetical protein
MSQPSAPSRRAFGPWLIALTATLAFGAFVASAMVGEGPATTRPHRTRTGAQLQARTPPAREIERAEPPPALAASDRRSAARAARGFLSAFLAYEVAALTRPERNALEGWSTPALALALLAHPPRPIPGATPGRGARVRELTLTDVTASRLQYLVNIRRSSTAESFSLTLIGRRRHWRVAAIGD